MILVAGLAVAGLVGIAAAFYFSLRSGNSGYKRSSRARSAGSSGPSGAGRTGTQRADSRPRADRRTSTDRPPGSRSGGAATAGRPVNGRRGADNSRAANAGRPANAAAGNHWDEDRTGPTAVMDFGNAGDPGLADDRGPVPPASAGRRTRAQARQEQQIPTVAAPMLGAASMDDAPDDLGLTDPRLGEFTTGSRAAARPSRDASAADGSKSARSRRRVGFRKGAEIDEEMWPAESFGVTDDQFWDDLASDKPLTTTARSAQPGSGSRNRPSADRPPANRVGVSPLNAGAQGGARTSPARGATQPVPASRYQTAPGQPTPVQPAPVRQAPVQPAPVQPAPVQPAPVQPAPVQPAPVQPAAVQPVPAQGTAPYHSGPHHAAPYQAAPFSPAASQPARGGTQPNEAPGRRHASTSTGTGARAKEDPLTSAAFSLRSSGPVDGHSQQIPRRQLELPAGGTGGRGTEPRSGTGPVRAYDRTSAYPPAGQAYSGPAQEMSAPQPAGTGPYDDVYGHVSGYASPADDPRWQNGARGPRGPGGPGGPGGPRGPRSHSRPDGADDPRPAYYPGHGNQPGNGNYPGHSNQPSGYQGSGYPGGPYDPREDYRRLTVKRLPLAH
jgi:hypothetical protein